MSYDVYHAYDGPELSEGEFSTINYCSAAGIWLTGINDMEWPLNICAVALPAGRYTFEGRFSKGFPESEPFSIEAEIEIGRGYEFKTEAEYRAANSSDLRWIFFGPVTMTVGFAVYIEAIETSEVIGGVLWDEDY